MTGMLDRPEKLVFGALLRRLREERGASLRALAKALRISAPFLSDVELGKRGPLDPDRVRRAEVLLESETGKLMRAAKQDVIARWEARKR